VSLRPSKGADGRPLLPPVHSAAGCLDHPDYRRDEESDEQDRQDEQVDRGARPRLELAGVWESEDGPTRRTVCCRECFWDGPLTWLDDTRLAVWGYGTDDEHWIAAVRVFDVTTGAELDWFPGPRGALVFDRELASLDGLTLWDVKRGARLARDPAQLARYHPGAKIYAGLPASGELATCRVRGIDAAASWSTPTIRTLARRIAHDRAFAELPVLGDALLLAGCPDADMIAHCHAPGEHGARCWVLDRLVEP